jgi:hypothetical protein
MAHQMQKQNESCVWLTELVFGPGHACANSRSRPGPPDTTNLCVPGEPGARHSRQSRARVSRPPQSRGAQSLALPSLLSPSSSSRPRALPPPRAPLAPTARTRSSPSPSSSSLPSLLSVPSRELCSVHSRFDCANPLLGFAVSAIGHRCHSPSLALELSLSPSSSPSAVEASSRFRQKVRRFEYHLLPSPSVVELFI